MRFVSSLTEEQTQALRELHKSSSTHRARQRAHAVLLSAKGYTLTQLADIFDLDRDTISQWLTVWERQGNAALSDAPKPGRPCKLDEATRTELIQTIQQAPSATLKNRLLQNLKKKASKSVGRR